MIGCKVEAPGAALLHLVFLHFSFLLIEKLLYVTRKMSEIQHCRHVVLKSNPAQDTNTDQ